MNRCLLRPRINQQEYHMLPDVSGSPRPPCFLLPGHTIHFDNQDASRKRGKLFSFKYDEQVDSYTWLKKYGLKANKLTYPQILGMTGFKQTQDYESPLGKQVTSRYGSGLFLKTQTKDGTVYNVTAEANKLVEFKIRLEEMLEIYETRLRWLNSDSRRLFGVIAEQNVCLVLDCKQPDANKLSQFRNSLLNLVCEQLSRLRSFNMIRCGADSCCDMFRPAACAVSAKSIDEAIEWLNQACNCHFGPTHQCGVDTSTCEAIMTAFQDPNIDAVYLISEGVSSNGLREVLYDKIVKESFNKQIKLNIVSYNCNEPTTIEYLKRLASNSFGPGQFHAYCLLRELDDFTAGPISICPTITNVVVNKRGFGGAPPGAGVKPDQMALFEEIQATKEALDNVNTILKTMSDLKAAQAQISPDVNNTVKPRRKIESFNNVENLYVSSKEWLVDNGLTAKRLDLCSVLESVSFMHCDAVLDVKNEPTTGKVTFINGNKYIVGDAIPKEKLVNARYCSQFTHVCWHDETIRHVHVTPELVRRYEQRLAAALVLYQKRIDWLSKGSRQLFGHVSENNLCILIDTSESMQPNLEFVKKKLMALLHEQLSTKKCFNLVAFNSKVTPWRERLVEVNTNNIKNASDWIQTLNAAGTTNTSAAIRFALNDSNTEAIYLLSDGRPDQEPQQILDMRLPIPINTISFNCNDPEANAFLEELSERTHGTHHHFLPFNAEQGQSNDINELKKEITEGKQTLVKLKKLIRAPEEPKPEMAITIEDIESHDWILPETKEYLSLILQGAGKKEKKIVVKKVKKLPQKKISFSFQAPKNPRPPSPESSEESQGPIKALMDKMLPNKLVQGNKVIAKDESSGYYFSGKISKANSSTKYNIAFDLGRLRNKAELSKRDVIKFVLSSYLTAGDHVMANVINENLESCWVPGVVQLKLTQPASNMYTILYFNGQEGDNRIAELIRIKQQLYGEVVNDIRSRIGFKTNLRNIEDNHKSEATTQTSALQPQVETVVALPNNPPDFGELKEEILNEIKVYFKSLQLDEQYQKMFDEFVKKRRKSKRKPQKIVINVQQPPPPQLTIESPKPVPLRLPTPQPLIEPPVIYSPRKESPILVNLLEVGDKVLAKWPDDGWYYKSQIIQVIDPDNYRIKDSIEDTEFIRRDDIIPEKHNSDLIEVNDLVVALHPDYESSYAPGRCVAVSKHEYEVEFYDYCIAAVRRKDIYKLKSRQKYEADVGLINALEKNKVGTKVVARNNRTHVYELGEIVERIGSIGTNYKIEWSNGTQAIQKSIHMFGPDTRKPQIKANDYVMAPKETIYLPGKVIDNKSKQFKVKFIDGIIDVNVNADDCFWISQDYYEDACNFINREFTSDDNEN